MPGPSLCDAVYMRTAGNAVNYSRVISLIATINWDVNTLQDQHNSYVDVLLRVSRLIILNPDEFKLLLLQ